MEGHGGEADADQIYELAFADFCIVLLVVVVVVYVIPRKLIKAWRKRAAEEKRKEA